MAQPHDHLTEDDVAEMWLGDHDTVVNAVKEQREATERINLAIWKDGQDNGYAKGITAGYRQGRVVSAILLLVFGVLCGVSTFVLTVAALH